MRITWCFVQEKKKKIRVYVDTLLADKKSLEDVVNQKESLVQSLTERLEGSELLRGELQRELDGLKEEVSCVEQMKLCLNIWYCPLTPS